jgi:O-acetylserine/cysteine efflux transporter
MSSYFSPLSRIPYPLLATLVALCWGGNFVAAKLVLQELPPFLLLAVRFFITAALVLPFFPRPPAPMKGIAVISVLMGVAHFSCLYLSIGLGLDVSSAVISSQLGVPFSCLLGSILYQDRIGRWRALGMLIAFAGILIICGSPRIVAQYWQFLIACLGAFLWAVSNIFIKRLGDVNMLGVLGWMALFAAPQHALISLMVEDGQMHALATASLQTWLGLSYTVVMSTIVAYGLWYSLMRHHPISHVVPYSLLVPVFGLSAAQMFFAEPLTWPFMVGGVLTVAGVAVIVIRRPEAATREGA